MIVQRKIMSNVRKFGILVIGGSGGRPACAPQASRLCSFLHTKFRNSCNIRPWRSLTGSAPPSTTACIRKVVTQKVWKFVPNIDDYIIGVCTDTYVLLPERFGKKRPRLVRCIAKDITSSHRCNVTSQTPVVSMTTRFNYTFGMRPINVTSRRCVF